MESEGFEVPIHKAFVQPLLLGGAPRDFALLNGTMTAWFLLAIHSFFGVFLGVALQALAARMAKDDPEFLDVFRRALKIKRYYE